MDTQPIDLSPLDPTADPELRERLVAAILARVAPELERRAAMPSALLLVAFWRRPALAAAAALAAIAAGTLFWPVTPRPEAATLATATEAPPGIADALEVPTPVAAFVVGGQDPTRTDLISALEGELP